MSDWKDTLKEANAELDRKFCERTFTMSFDDGNDDEPGFFDLVDTRTCAVMFKNADGDFFDMDGNLIDVPASYLQEMHAEQHRAQMHVVHVRDDAKREYF